MSSSSNGRVLALDGARALCILSVLFAHASGTGVIPITRLMHPAADLGVRGFFVLSGFLITGLLLRDERRPLGVAMRDFYARRALRIFPAFYVFIAGVMVLASAGLATWSSHDALFAATYSMNFHGERVWSLGHLWSLAVEEQFYLLWPAILLGLRPRRATSALLAAVVLAPVVRLAVFYLWPAQRALTDQAFPCVFDALATGCLLAMFRKQLERDPRYMAMLTSRAFWLVPLLCIATLVITHPSFQLGIAPTLANAGVALALHRLLSVRTFATRMLETRVLVKLGVLSYSIYLWQQVFLDRHWPLWFHRFPVNVAFAVLAGAASYSLVERPFLRMTSRFRAARTSPLPDALAPSYRVSA
jgi:peptidoglycan/LPS O-acetylase OafA/YrhL